MTVSTLDLTFRFQPAKTSVLFYSAPHNCTAVGYLQYAIPKGFGAGKMRIHCVDERRNCETVPHRFFYSGNMCHSGVCHIILLFVSVITMLTCGAFKRPKMLCEIYIGSVQTYDISFIRWELFSAYGREQ